MSVLPSKEDFATEVKADRLKILYRVAAVFCGVTLLVVLTFGMSQRGSEATNPTYVVAGVIIELIACALTHELLRRNMVTLAAWVFILGAIVAVGAMLALGDNTTQQMYPFVMPVIILVGGMLVAPWQTFLLTAIAALVIIAAPASARGTLLPTTQQTFSIFLMVLSAVFAAQVTGELYQITEWALSNYQRERRTNDELYEKRHELQMTLKRSEALGEKLQETNSQLAVAHAAAEEAKTFRGKFLANMSHELRTPLNAIIGFSETMLQFPIMYDNENLPPPYERDLGQIYNSGRQLLHVINDILDLAKVDAGKLEIHMMPVDMKPLINAVVSTAKGLLGPKPVRLEMDVPEELPKAWGDETRLRQVLLNLYSNACKYTDAGLIKLRVRVLDDELEFAIQDTGIGVDAEYQNKLFQEFQQAKSGGRDPRSGSGLGLAISKQLLELMNGKIWLTSKQGEGSTFYFTVQLYKGQERVTVSAATNANAQAAQPIAQTGA
jgi:signal transduction histidine kinase